VRRLIRRDPRGRRGRTRAGSPAAPVCGWDVGGASLLYEPVLPLEPAQRADPPQQRSPQL